MDLKLANCSSGIIVLSASAVGFIHFREHGRYFLKDVLRLVLVGFLGCAGLWAVMGFTATLLSDGAASPCQVVVAFGAVFDQLARLAIEQFLLGSIHRGFPMGKSGYLAQVIIVLRLLLGGVFVAVQRPDFSPVCVASNILFPIGIAATGVDVFMCCAFITKLFTLPVRKHPTMEITLGFTIWTAVCTRYITTFSRILTGYIGKFTHDARLSMAGFSCSHSRACSWPLGHNRHPAVMQKRHRY